MMPIQERIEMALGAMLAAGPRDLRAYLAQPGPDMAKASVAEVDDMIELLLASDPNGPARLRFSNLLRAWDNAKGATWIADSARNTAERRKRIHERLRSTPEIERRIDDLMPYYHLDEPLIIAAEHQDWYKPQLGVRDYYWSTYVRYLQQEGGWETPSLLSLDNHTRAIVECIADPESAASYASRGLVMGYVQSGKTANFMGVAARAADAGYRLIIVLAGTWNILRNQTQRRFDKELLGKELLRNDEAYTDRPPPDWAEFLEHGGDPAELGQYTWQRLTRPDIDFRRLRSAIDNLEFEKRNPAAPIFDVSNLHSLPVKLLVVKKHSGILHNLVKDLRLIRTKLTDLPTVIIDDESDQAGLNTVDPNRVMPSGAERSKTNMRIVELLGLFPRGQYIGYTATPYANALIKPDDPEDLYPKDFILPLDRPQGYMGVSDFFDPTAAYEDLQKDDYTQSEIAHIRRVTNPVGADDEDLKAALRSYVLAGGMKLYRLAIDSQRYKPEYVRHHTMLVHTSPRKGEMTTIAARLKDLWDQCAFNGPDGSADLKSLWDNDYAKVCAAKDTDVQPGSYEELIPYLSEAIKRIEKGPKIFLVVNSDTVEAPDFSAAPVWKIVIGGNKLSRGYTIEGLTVSYYRRVAGTADTLMQMGRWFGFRPGYQDLVRVFLGVAEGKRGSSDLVSLFKDVCRMEERFREDIRRYVRRPGAPRITPSQIPALISVTGSLPPTARNKMFNAILANKNFGGQSSMLTLAPTESTAVHKNIETMTALMGAAKSFGSLKLGGTSATGKTLETNAVVLEATNEHLISFLKSYRWLESDFRYPMRPADTDLQIEFLEKQKHDISSWLIIAPQRKESFGVPLNVRNVGDMTVKERHREEEGRGFQVFGEPIHRTIAKYFADIDPGEGKDRLALPNAETKRLRRAHSGVILLYPVREKERDKVSIGFELFFPQNELPFDVNFTVRRKAEKAKIVVQDSAVA
jgi:hypothetical protein